MKRVDLTLRQIFSLQDDLRSYRSNCGVYMEKITDERNGYFEIVTDRVYFDECILKHLFKIAKKHHTTFMLFNESGTISLRFYAEFGELPKKFQDLPELVEEFGAMYFPNRFNNA